MTSANMNRVVLASFLAASALSVLTIVFAARAQFLTVITVTETQVEDPVPEAVPQQQEDPVDATVPEISIPEVPTSEQTLLGLSQVCYSESRRRSDCRAIWQVARTIRGCVTSEGSYTRCSNPHVRREHALEALRRHSGRVLGVRPTTKRRLLAIRNLQLNGTRPELMDPQAWRVAERQAWLETIEWAREAIAENPNPCPQGPSTWGSPVVDSERIARMTSPDGRYDIVHCGSTANKFLRVRR